MSTIYNNNRVKVGIVIDFTLRFPDFANSYNQMKKEIIEGENATETEVTGLKISYFKELSKKSKEAYDFYLTTPTPTYDDSFDYSFKNYFFSKEDLDNFLETWSFNLFGTEGSLKKINTEYINICQSKVCDVYLIDRSSFTRKIPNTLSFLSKARVFFKGLISVKSETELKKLRKEFYDFYDPADYFSKKTIEYTLKENKFLDWLEKLAKKIEKLEI